MNEGKLGMIRATLAAVLLAVVSTAASAAVAPRTPVSAPSADVVEVQDRRDRGRFDRNLDRRRWVPGRRYDAPPPRWRRYGGRPRDWRSRGCVIVGPVWFCP